MLGPFRIERLLGKGGMATVYEAYEGGVLERVVALKVLPPEFLHDGTFASRFTQEARFAAALEHSNIVPIYASGINDGIPWMSMRLITGGTVADLLAENSNGVGGEQLWRILHGVAEALDYAHARGVIHRDIKPSNILLDKDGRAYIGDFGLALLMEGGERFTQTRTALGTPRYMAPEQAIGLAVDPRCDIYSLGVVGYEMLTGTTPFRGSALGILKQHLEDPVPVPDRALVSEARFNVLKKALAKKPGERWQSAGQFIAELATTASMTGKRRQYSVVVRWAWVTTALSAGLFLLWSAASMDPTPSRVEKPTPPAAAQPIEPAPQLTQPAPSVTPPTSSPSIRPSTQPATTPSRSQTNTQSTTRANSPLPPSPVSPSAQPPPATTPDDGGTASVNAPPAAAEVIVSRPVVLTLPAEPGGDVVTNPERIGTFRPDYPRNARTAKIEGDVHLEVVILPDGKVGQVRVLTSPNPALNNAAIRAVQQSNYKPGLRNGKPDTFTIDVTVSFRLN
jgi:serine/threonine-protein kinase